MKSQQRFFAALPFTLFALELSACAVELPVEGTGGSGLTGGSGPVAGSPATGGGGIGPAGSGGSNVSGQGGSSAGLGGTSPAGAGGTGAGGTGAGGTGVGGAGGTPMAGSGGAGAGSGGGASGAAGTGAGAGGASGAGGGGGKGGAGGVAGAAGAGGKGGAGGSGGAPSFAPCPATGACKVLPLGDSITDGFGTPGGYRMELFHLALQAQKTMTYVGGSMNGPTMVNNVLFPRAHEGHSGWTIPQIDGIVPSPALGVDPHIILLHIGTNDINGNATDAPNRLATLLDQIIADSPDALLVVAQIIPLTGRTTQIMAFNNAIPPLVTARANMGKHIALVNMYTGFPSNELADGVHPNPTGYARMAGVWYRAISSYLR